MRVLLTGANGFLGQHLSCAFVEAGVDLTRTTRNGDTQSLSCELTSKEDVESMMLRINPDLIVHCAAFVPKTLEDYNDEKLTSLNSKMLENILVFTKAPIVYISSMTVYGTSDSITRTESDAGAPESAYGISKYAGELILKQYDRDSLIVRIPGLFGTARDSGLVSNTIRALLKNQAPSLPGKPILWAAMDVEDAAAIIVQLSVSYDFKGFTPVNVGYPDVYSINRFLVLCEEVFQKTIEYRVIHPEFEFDLTQLKALGAYSSKTLKDTLITLRDKYERPNN